MKHVIFLALLGTTLTTAYAGSCRPTYNTSAAWGGLPPTWGSYRRYNRCCLAQDLYADVQLGAYRLNSPGFSFGEELAPLTGEGIAALPEFFIGNDHVNAFYPRLTLGVEMNSSWNPCWVGSTFFFEVGGSYISCDKFLDLGNGIFTNFALPQLNGGGDFIAETAGVETEFSGVDFKRRYRYSNVSTKLGSNMFFKGSPRFSLVPFLEIDFSYLQQGYFMNIGAITGGAFATRVRTKEILNTKYYDFGVGADAVWFFSPCCRTPFIFGEIVGFASSSHTTLSARESALFPLLGTITQRLHKEHDNFTGKVRGQLGVGYQFGYNFGASIMGQIDYWGFIPKVINPHRIETTPSTTGLYDRPAHIVGKTTTNWALVLNLNFIFY